MKKLGISLLLSMYLCGCAINNSSSMTSNNTTNKPTKKFVVTFDADTGRFTDTKSRFKRVSVEKGKRVDSPEEPKRLGYAFKGWFEENSYYEYPYDFSERVEFSFTLYAKWEKLKECTVTFDANGGVFASDYRTTKLIYKIYEGEKIAKPYDIPYKEGIKDNNNSNNESTNS